MNEKYKLLFSIVEDNIDNIYITEENASFLNLKIDKSLRRQNTESNLLRDYPTYTQ